MQEHGVLILNKPSSLTSHACLRKIKRTLGQQKIGHAGTLDPMVDGVLLVLLGHATKISQYLMQEGVKIYKGTLKLGEETDTWDKEGVVLNTRTYEHISKECLMQVFLEYQGSIRQEVPPISAAKYNGKSLYKIVRMGHTPPRKFKNVQIYSLEICSISLPYMTFRVSCSSGTYIRSLAHSLGKRLGCGAILEKLTREYSYPFSIEDSVPLNSILEETNSFPTHVKPLIEVLSGWERVDLTEEERNSIVVGRPIVSAVSHAHNRKAVLLYQSFPLALAQFHEESSMWKVLRGL
ncbi:MAG: tRNA pseudouridine(55) synthase TruB [Desulfovibrionaceae bacterium]